jgi:hypothetical protein
MKWQEIDCAFPKHFPTTSGEWPRFSAELIGQIIQRSSYRTHSFQKFTQSVDVPAQGQMKPEQLDGSNDGHTLTSGTFGTVPRRGGLSSRRGPYGLRRDVDRRFLARRGSGSFSGRGFTGPSG